jgi:hypothetical protein
MKIKVILGDDNNEQFREEVVVEVSFETFLALKYAFDEDYGLYLKHWYTLCDLITDARPYLPCDWFIDEVILDNK